MIENKPNIFEFATKELSQDAVFCYILDCFHAPKKKWIAERFLQLLDIENADDIQRLEIRRQEDDIDVKAVVNFRSGAGKYIILEDKVYSSLHSDQLVRYKNATQKREGCAEADIIGIFFKLGEPEIWEKRACERAGFRVLDHEALLSLVEQVKDDPVLEDFAVFFRQRLAAVRRVDACCFGKLEDEHLEELISSRYGQRKLAKWMMKQIFGDAYRETKQYTVNNFGSPCTQYRFVFDAADTAKDWELPEQEMPRADYSCFFRIDRNAGGWYLSLRQYFRSGAKGAQETDFIRLRRELLKQVGDAVDDAPNRCAKKEKTLLLYNIPSVEQLRVVLEKMTKAAACVLKAISGKEEADHE